MRIIILIITAGFCFNASGQKDTPVVKFSGTPGEVLIRKGDTLKTTPIEKVDSLSIPIFSTNDVSKYLGRIYKKLTALLELQLITAQDYDKIIIEMNKINVDMDKKRKGIK